MGIRRPRVSGAFYPSHPDSLRKTIEGCFTHRLGPGRLPGPEESERKIVSVVCPHAGYMYSGPAAAHSYFHLASETRPDTAVILGPNHTGLGSPIAVGGIDSWETPLGVMKVNRKMVESIFKASDFIDVDDQAHLREHSIEVHLPFLQFLYGSKLSIVPICMGFQDLESSREVGRAVAEAVKGENAVIIASTDLTHQETQESAVQKDRLVIDSILHMDEAELHDKVRRNRITMCGYGPVSASLVASKILGAKKAELLSYYTSGDVLGDHSAVVGYASAKITR